MTINALGGFCFLKGLIIIILIILGGCGGHVRSDFRHRQFLLWEGVVVLKRLVLDHFHLGGGCGGPVSTDFYNFYLVGVVVLKGLIFSNFHLGRM